MFYYGKVINKITGAPMAGVAMSDGRNIAYTGDDGCYQLPGWERSATLCACVLTKCHNDWFYYTEGQPGEYNFALSPAESREFKILQTSDTEIKNRTDLHWLDFFREKIDSENPVFLIHTGDISSREGLERHRREMNFDTMGCPVRYVIGNHDFIKDNVDYGEQLYEQLYGPLWYSFDCAGIHCVVLSMGRGSKGAVSGYTQEDQWQWLKNELEVLRQGKPMVMFCHNHGPDAYEFIAGDIDLKQHGLVAWIYGHSHSNSHHVRNGVHIINTARPDCGGIDSSLAGIRQIQVKEGQVSSQMHYIEFPVAAADTPVWQQKLPGKVTFCQMVEADGDLLVGTMRDTLPEQAGICRLSKESGEVQWFFQTRGGINTDISLDGDKVYAQDCMGWSYCLAADTGSLIWEKENYLGGSGRTMLPGFLAGQVVLAGKYTALVALDKNTGEVAWLAPEVKRGGNTPARPVYDSQNQRLYVSAQWGYLACLDIVTGEDIWRRTEKPIWYRTQTPCLDGDVLYTGGFDTIMKLDAATGETILEADIGQRAQELGAPVVETDGQINVCGGPVVDGDVLYCPTASAGVLALDKNSLAVLRRFSTGTAAVLTAPYVGIGAQTVESQPVIAHDLLIFTATDGKLYIYNKNTARLVNTIVLPGPSLVAPVVNGRDIYTADITGSICKYTM